MSENSEKRSKSFDKFEYGVKIGVLLATGFMTLTVGRAYHIAPEALNQVVDESTKNELKFLKKHLSDIQKVYIDLVDIIINLSPSELEMIVELKGLLTGDLENLEKLKKAGESDFSEIVKDETIDLQPDKVIQALIDILKDADPSVLSSLNTLLVRMQTIGTYDIAKRREEISRRFLEVFADRFLGLKD